MKKKELKHLKNYLKNSSIESNTNVINLYDLELILNQKVEPLRETYTLLDLIKNNINTKYKSNLVLITFILTGHIDYFNYFKNNYINTIKYFIKDNEVYLSFEFNNKYSQKVKYIYLNSKLCIQNISTLSNSERTYLNKIIDEYKPQLLYIIKVLENTSKDNQTLFKSTSSLIYNDGIFKAYLYSTTFTIKIILSSTSTLTLTKSDDVNEKIYQSILNSDSLKRKIPIKVNSLDKNIQNLVYTYYNAHPFKTKIKHI